MQDNEPTRQDTGDIMNDETGRTTRYSGLTKRGEAETLVVTRPVAMSFVFRYLMAFTPLLLVAVSLGIRGLQESLYLGASHLVPELAPIPSGHATAASASAMSQYLSSMNAYTTGINEITAISVLLVAPVGIFLLGAGTGAGFRLTEMWTSTSLTLLLSAGTAVALAGSPAFTAAYGILLLQWIAFLVQPFCIIASLIVFWYADKFRRSITYTITPLEIRIQGGVVHHVDQTFPHRGTGGIVLEQDLLGTRFNYGTIIPRRMMLPPVTSPSSGRDLSGLKDLTGYGNFPGGNLRDLTHDPLDCLYGIPDPETTRRILVNILSPHSVREL
jgi:hypothetical protein